MLLLVLFELLVLDVAAPLPTARAVDLPRYMGTWYEIARYPNRFQRGCVSDVTAAYTLRPDGKVDVLNSCRAGDGHAKSARGTAKVVDKATNAKLKVTFFWPFSGDYWIVALDPDYRWVIVGEPRRKFLWILARTPVLPPATYDEVLRHVAAAGYDPAALIPTVHSAR